MLSAVAGEWARERRVWAGWLMVLRGMGEFVPDMMRPECLWIFPKPISSASCVMSRQSCSTVACDAVLVRNYSSLAVLRVDHGDRGYMWQLREFESERGRKEHFTFDMHVTMATLLITPISDDDDKRHRKRGTDSSRIYICMHTWRCKVYGHLTQPCQGQSSSVIRLARRSRLPQLP